MINKQNWEHSKRRFMELWALENHDRPLIELCGIKNGSKPKRFTHPDSIAERWLNAEYAEKVARDKMECTYYAYEAFPTYMPDLGPDILGAILGDDIEFAQETSYSKHLMTEDEWATRAFAPDKNNIWYKRIMHMSEYIARQAKGDYLVGLADYHPGCDALVSLRGPENLCLDLGDYPNEIKRANMEILQTFRQVLRDNHSMLSKYQEGSTTWMHVWHPDLWYVTSCDFICMISQGMFDEFVAEELQAELDFLDASIYHLDGPAAINRHLDRLLEFPKLKGVQVTYGAGAGIASGWLSQCKKVQDAGKIVHLSVAPEDIREVSEALKPEGLFLDVSRKPYDMLSEPFTQSEVEDIQRMIESVYKT